MVKEIWYPKHLLVNGIAATTKGSKGAINLAACDTEGKRGTGPYTFQWSSKGDDAEVYDVDGKTILDAFIERVTSWAQRDATNLLTFHNFQYDLQALLWDPRHGHHFAKPARDFVIPLGGERQGARDRWIEELNEQELSPAVKEQKMEPPAGRLYSSYLHCFTDKNWFAKLHLPSHRIVTIVDSMAYFPTSLDEAAKLVRSPFQKLDHPRDSRCEVLDPGRLDDEHVLGCRCLGEANLRGDDGFEEYVRNDVRAQWHVGAAIGNMLKEHDVPVCVSLPHLASSVFKRRFVPKDEPIPFPPRRVSKAAEMAYHGGLNFMTVDPGWYDCWEIDINSAYAWAMTQLPCLSKGEWLQVDRFVPGSWGFFLASGTARCPYGVAHTHDFKKLEGRFKDTWMTTMEVEAGARHGCMAITDVEAGWVWVPEDGSRPFADWVWHWWGEKKKHKKSEGLAYDTPKKFVNTLYGKCIQTTKFMKNLIASFDGRSQVVDVWKAGGIYHAPAAAWITALVRSNKLHEMAHAAEADVDGTRYPALHGSTDSIKTMRDPAHLPDIGPELGQWSIEAKGPCLLVRTKFYVHEKEECVGRLCPKCRGSGCVKTAWHGAPGLGRDLKRLIEASEALVSKGEFDYLFTHVNSIREVMRQTKAKRVPLDFDRLPKSLRIEAVPGRLGPPDPALRGRLTAAHHIL